MKNMPKKSMRYSSDFDDRPIYDPSDNLYAGMQPDVVFENVEIKKKLKTERNSEKTRENHAFDCKI